MNCSRRGTPSHAGKLSNHSRIGHPLLCPLRGLRVVGCFVHSDVSSTNAVRDSERQFIRPFGDGLDSDLQGACRTGNTAAKQLDGF